MHIRASVFFSFWSLVGFLSLSLGIGALENTDLPKSVPPLVMSFFKISLLISACHSSNYALVFRRPKLIGKYYISVLLVILPILSNLIPRKLVDSYAILITIIFSLGACYYCLYRNNFILDPSHSESNYKLKVLIKYLVFDPLPLIYYYLHRNSMGYFTLFVFSFLLIFHLPTCATFGLYGIAFSACAMFAYEPLFIANFIYLLIFVMMLVFFTSTIWEASISGDNRFRRWMPPPVLAIWSNLRTTMKRNGKVIEFGAGMGGTIIFQNYFRLTTFDHVVVFLYLAVAWLANLALLLCPYDFGIFNFIMVNVIVGCTVSEFGLSGTTWLVYGTCLLMYILRLKLETLSVVDRGEGEEAVVVWGGERITSDGVPAQTIQITVS